MVAMTITHIEDAGLTLGPAPLLAALGGLAVALAPLGITVLRDGSAPRWWAVALTAALIPVAFLIGVLG
jgi:hypothetical protein